ncbi:MAG: hypothetical protein AAF684_11660, partial [Pseudomonadota bacterium]
MIPAPLSRLRAPGFAAALAFAAVPAAAAPDSFADLAERVTPAVVNVAVEFSQTATGEQPFNPFSQDSPFREFFERFGIEPPQGGPGGPRGPRRGQGVGSGFVIS